MSKTVRVGVIGLGMIAERAHLPHFAAARGSKLVAVSSSRASAARAAQRRYALECVYSDWGELVASDRIDAIAICAPNDVHAEITLEALRFGKHVLVEKPMATRASDAEKMLKLAHAQRKILAVHHNLRFHPVAIAGRNALQRGLIGEVLGFEGVLCHRGPKGWAPRAAWFFDEKRVGGGVLMDLGVHTFDLLRYFVADAPERIAVTRVGAAKASGGSAEHHASCLVTLATGAAGTVTVSWRDSTYRNRWYFTGERGALELDFTGDGRVTLHGVRGPKQLPLPAARAVPTAQQAFVDRILGKRMSRTEPLSAGGEDGCAALKLCLAALQASRTSASVRIQLGARSRS